MKLIHHSRPSIHERDIRLASRAMREQNIGYGIQTYDFTSAFQAYTQSPYVTFTNSGSSALHLALLALHIGKNDNVILPSYCCAAVLNSIRYTGANPQFVDIIPETFNIDPGKVKKAINKRTKAIIVPHMFGLPAEVRDILKYRVPLIEDCSMSFGAKINKQMTGTFADISMVSFYATKVMTTGSGGAVFTKRKSLHRQILDLVQYDNRNDYKVRYNYEMNTISKAIGLSQLSLMPSFLKKRAKIADIYSRSLRDLPIHLPPERRSGHIYYRYVLGGIKNVRNMLAEMKHMGIECKRPVYRPLHQYFADLRGKFPGTDQAYRGALSIPIYPDLKDTDVRKIISAIRSFPGW